MKRHLVRRSGMAAAALALAVLWFWCRGGGGSVLRISVSGDDVSVFLDNRLVVQGRDARLSPAGRRMRAPCA